MMCRTATKRRLPKRAHCVYILERSVSAPCRQPKCGGGRLEKVPASFGLARLRKFPRSA
jgi:hypothetical protein